MIKTLIEKEYNAKAAVKFRSIGCRTHRAVRGIKVMIGTTDIGAAGFLTMLGAGENIISRFEVKDFGKAADIFEALARDLREGQKIMHNSHTISTAAPQSTEL